MLRRKIERARRRIQALSSTLAARRQADPLAAQPGTIVTVFYDVEGDYAMPGQSAACIGTAWKILELEERLGIRSTYNMVARLAQEAPDLVAAIVRAGSELASHSLDHRVLIRLPRAALADNVRRTRDAYAGLGVRVIGHRSPQSAWNRGLMELLRAEGFRWSAEDGTEPHPYRLAGEPGNALWRFPVADDDWHYGRDPSVSPSEVLTRWQSCVRSAIAAGRRHIAIGFHPWVEAPRDRFAIFETFMHWLMEQRDVRVMPFREVLQLMEESGRAESDDSRYALTGS